MHVSSVLISLTNLVSGSFFDLKKEFNCEHMKIVRDLPNLSLRFFLLLSMTDTSYWPWVLRV